MRVIRGPVVAVDRRSGRYAHSGGSYTLLTFELGGATRTRVMMQPNLPLRLAPGDEVAVAGFFLGSRFMAMAYHNVSRRETWRNHPRWMAGLGAFVMGLGLVYLATGEHLPDTLLLFSPFVLVGAALLLYARVVARAFQKVVALDADDV
jgi:hypothetical protein